MKSLLVLVISALVLAAQTASTLPAGTEFRVEKIDSAQQGAIAKAELDLEKAAAALLAAQKAAADAKEKRDAAVSAVTQKYGVFEGPCERPSPPSSGNMVLAVYISPAREFKRVELRGGYALITSGKEACGSYGTGALTFNTPLSGTSGVPALSGGPQE